MSLRHALHSVPFATLLLVAALAPPAHALAPAAVTRIAVQLGRSLPVGWGAAEDAAVAAAIAADAAARAADPERDALAHRYDVTTAVDAAAAATVDPRGGALDAFAAALEALRRARLAPDAAGVVGPVAALAVAACDLADPFLVTAPDADEVPGARAAFEDTWDDAAIGPAAAGDAAGLAAASAAVRPDLEAAAVTGDDAAIGRLRAARLGAALAVAQAAAAEAWSTTSVAVPADLRPATVSLWPNPARGAVQVGFALPVAATARLTVADLGGRRVLDRELGARAAGAQSVVLDAPALRRLAAGMYFVRVTAGTMTLEGRLVRVQQP